MQAFHQAIDATTKQVLSLVDKTPFPIILIDGRAASGKSTFAASLQNKLFKELEQLPRLIHMDDLYPGWEGLRAGSNYLNQQILQPLSKGNTASWQIWDWANSKRGNPTEPGNGWREFDLSAPLIVEGCGALSRVSKEYAQLSIWIEAEPEQRRQRWSEREGQRFDDYWPIWLSQEDEFYQDEKSSQLADLVVRN